MPYDPFIDVSDLYAYLRLPPPGDTDDLATIALDAACYTIRGFLHQTINRVDNEIIAIDTDGSDTIMVPEAPLISVSDVQMIAAPVWVTDDFSPGLNTVIDPSSYLVEYDRGMLVLRAGGSWGDDRGSVQLTYTHGWDVIPTDIRIVALTVAARIYDQGLAKAETIGNARLVYSHDESLGLSPREKDILVKYRRAGVPRHYSLGTGPVSPGSSFVQSIDGLTGEVTNAEMNLPPDWVVIQ